MNVLEPLDITCWKGPFAPEILAKAVDALEGGRVMYAPQLHFELSAAEGRFLSPECLDGKSKNISYRPDSGALRGTSCQGSHRDLLLSMLQRYHNRASELVKALCPGYGDHLQSGFTSFRPAEVAGRGTSWRQDDTRLHVDAFPSRPMQGIRILRVFTNVNPHTPRTWRVGEPFEQVAAKYLPDIRPPFPGSSSLLLLFRVVKARRTEYDHFMLGIHDRMKADQAYQSRFAQNEVAFPPGATWACFTDWVSHAAMSGQFAFEQTFYLPVAAMHDPQRSPLRVLERLSGHALV
ncbi:MAG: Kdo hydroxylase family protein [Acidobacteriaceae bacterium]|nr:Kdo hydroxylase family protein [Acidobacteriaceae bacterium]